GMDLANIFKDTSAAAMNLPRNRKSYNNKPWCYFFFKTQEALDAATEMKFSLRKRELEWCGPDDIKKLCPRCSSLAHSAKDCDAFNSRGRGRSNIPKSLLNNYERFKPAGYKPSSSNYNNRNRNRSNSRSRSRSRSNSRAARPSNNNNNDSDKSSKPSNPSRPNSKGRNVTYANAAAGSSRNQSLDDSIHTPKNKGKGKEIAHQTPPAPLVEALLVMIKELSTQLSEARDDYEHLKADMAAHDARLSAIEQHLSNPTASPVSPQVTSPMDISPNDSLQGSPVTNKITPSTPATTPAPSSSTFSDRLEHIDGKYNS